MLTSRQQRRIISNRKGGHSPIVPTIGSRIRNRREELGLSQDELGKKIRYKSRSSINKIELDQRNLTQSKIKAIADALDTTPAYIMGWNEPNQKLDAEKLKFFDNLFLPSTFCLKAKGDSMIGARIYDGDIVFIRKQEMVDDGEIAAVLIGDEATLKRVQYNPEENELLLFAENPKYKTMRYTGEELNHIRILGKAVAFQSDIR